MIYIEIVYAKPQQQIVEELQFAKAVTIRQAIAASKIKKELPYGLYNITFGVFGKVCELDYVLQDQDRVEVYRGLQMSPQAARRRRAESRRANLAK